MAERWTYTHGLKDLGNGLYAWLQPDGGWGWSNAGLIRDGDQSLLVDTLFDMPRERCRSCRLHLWGICTCLERARMHRCLCGTRCACPRFDSCTCDCNRFQKNRRYECCSENNSALYSVYASFSRTSCRVPSVSILCSTVLDLFYTRRGSCPRSTCD